MSSSTNKHCIKLAINKLLIEQDPDRVNDIFTHYICLDEEHAIVSMNKGIIEIYDKDDNELFVYEFAVDVKLITTRSVNNMFGAWYNLGGLGCEKPLKLRYEEEGQKYWVDEGDMKDDFDFVKTGLHAKEGCIRFMSENKAEVQAFIDGVRAVATIQSLTTKPFELEEHG